MRAWTTAARHALADAPREAAIARLASHLDYCSSPALCGHGRDALESATGIERDIALLAVATCGDERDEAVLDVEVAPAAARFRWLGARRDRGEVMPAASAGHLAAVRTLLELAVPRDFYEEQRARDAVGVLRAMPGGDAALRASMETLAPHPRELVMAALAVGTPDPASENAPTADAQAACAREGGWEGRACLDGLARTDRARAIAVAAEIDPSDEAMRASLDVLTRFPVVGGLEARLLELGLVGECAPSAQLRDAPAVLLACARGLSFDPETGTYPVGHDALLAELSFLAPGALDDVVWEEIPPAAASSVSIADYVTEDGELIENDEPEGPYALRAYSRGDRFEVPARQLDDWYDLEAVIALVNAVARERESDVRWLLVQPTGGNGATIVAGPEAGLRTAIGEHLLEPVATNASATARDAEAEFIRGLIERGEF
jgi:hypothetical protein